MIFRILGVLLLLPSLAFSYTVVRKDGRLFSGDLVSESKEEIILRDSRGIEVKFRIDQLDMKSTGAANSAAPQTRSLPQTNQAFTINWSGPGQWTGEPISVDFKDIDIRDFFRFIAEISGMNMILDPAVKGALTVKLHDVPWDQALDIVCRTHGLGYQVDGNSMSVKK
jgi:type II secretory pathway component HofQ